VIPPPPFQRPTLNDQKPQRPAPNDQNFCAVLPVYNHERTIAVVVEHLRGAELAVFLVDDGSSAACAEELDRLGALPGVTLLRHATNRGKGAAVCLGLRAATEAGFTHALQVDADCQHALTDVPRFVAEATKFPEAVICGQPVFDVSIPAARFYGRYLTHALVWVQTLSLEIRDAMCGFRIYPLAPMTGLLDRLGPRMEFDMEVLVRLHWRGVRTRWLKTPVIYPVNGVSHFRMLRDNVLITRMHLRLLAGMVLRLPWLLARNFTRRLRPAYEHA
jgi:glycosyltransferase involved in cell wall biosynthesis